MSERRLYRMIEEIVRNRGGKMQPPCREEALGRLAVRSRKELNRELPEDYTAFLSLMNGFVWNGVRIYASERILVGKEKAIDGVVEATRANWEHETMHKYLVVGDTNLDTLVYDWAKKKYLSLDRMASETVAGTFDGFDAMLQEILDSHLASKTGTPSS